MSTLDKVKKVVVDQLSCDEALVTPEASFTADNSVAKFLMKKLKKFKQFKMQLTTSKLTHN